MRASWSRTALSTYSLIGTAAFPFIGLYVGLRALRGKEDSKRWRERYGRSSATRSDGPLVWIHAASVGETSSVVPLVRQIVSKGIAVVLTTGTVTSAGLARERLGDSVVHQYVPLDMRPAVRRFLDRWKPDLALMAESEIWPVTIMELGLRRIPQVLVNGRLSDRSFERWQRRPEVARTLFSHFSATLTQTELDAERFGALGANPAIVSGNLKFDVEPPPCDEAERKKLTEALADRAIWAAVSTHDGEEAIAADVHKSLSSRHNLLTIIVPRHPDRADAILAMLKEKGLNVARRSQAELPDKDTDIFLGDTIGEMGLFLRLTDLVFVGRSLTGEGGQNPIEPAMLGAAVLAGPHVLNFREPYDLLIAANAARPVRDAAMLKKAVDFLLQHEDARLRMKERGLQSVARMRGGLSKTMQALDPFLHPLIVEAKLRRS